MANKELKKQELAICDIKLICHNNDRYSIEIDNFPRTKIIYHCFEDRGGAMQIFKDCVNALEDFDTYD